MTLFKVCGIVFLSVIHIYDFTKETKNGIQRKESPKKVREIVKEYKKSMLGKYTIVDAGGKKWEIRYDVLYWRQDWEELDYYCSCRTQKELFKDIPDAISRMIPDDCYVGIILMCGDKENTTHILRVDGSFYDYNRLQILI